MLDLGVFCLISILLLLLKYLVWVCKSVDNCLVCWGLFLFVV